MPIDTEQPFTRAQADAAGMTWRQLSGPRVHRLFHGVYVSTGTALTPALIARAAMLAVPAAIAVCRVSAAALRGLPVPAHDEVHLLVPPDGARVRRRGVRIHLGHRTRLSSHDGVPLTTAIDTFCDVADDVPLVDAVVLGDAMVRAGLVSVRSLGVATAALPGRRGSRARHAASLVRARVDSPAETRLRLLLVLSGLQEPEVGHRLVVSGRERALDLAYPEHRLAVEYDGGHHRVGTSQWSRDLRRREQIEGVGWRMVVINGDAMWDPAGVIQRVRDALERGGVALDPVRPEWRRHFRTRQSIAT